MNLGALETPRNNLGQKFRAIRINNQLTKEEVALLCDDMIEYISSVESGLASIHPSDIDKFSELFNVTPNYFYEGAECAILRTVDYAEVIRRRMIESREWAGLNYNDAGYIVGMDKVALERYELGQVSIPIYYMKRLSLLYCKNDLEILGLEPNDRPLCQVHLIEKLIKIIENV